MQIHELNNKIAILEEKTKVLRKDSQQPVRGLKRQDTGYQFSDKYLGETFTEKHSFGKLDLINFQENLDNDDMDINEVIEKYQEKILGLQEDNDHLKKDNEEILNTCKEQSEKIFKLIDQRTEKDKEIDFPPR